MTKTKMLYEKWAVHEWKSKDTQGVHYIGPVGGRQIVASYKTKETAEAVLEMRNWIAKELKNKKA